MPKVSRPKVRNPPSSKANPARSRSVNTRAAKAVVANTSRSRAVQPESGPPRSGKTENDRYVEIKQIAEKLGIHIQKAKFHTDRPGKVPIEHQAAFGHIQTLGATAYTSYGLQPNPDTIDKPWQLLNKKRATTLNDAAIDCKRLNEGTWREHVEYKLFERLKIEVACKRCRKRLWQSEIEVDPAAGNSKTDSLKERQEQRKSCECGPGYDLLDPSNTGLSNIFSSRIQERNILLSDRDADINHLVKEPDRIHGLQSTADLMKLLQHRYGPQSTSQGELEPSQQIADVLQTSCNPDRGGRNLLFPFLVMEAKSGMGGSHFDGTENQTLLPIRNALMLQYELQSVEFNRMKVPGGPIAWFLANIGEQWRVYGCCTTPRAEHPQPYSNIVLLWEGSITGLDEALQLVLIVDYILDWARDIYRPSIIRQLKSIAGRGAHSHYTVSHDPDIISIANPMDPMNQWLGGQGTEASVPANVGGPEEVVMGELESIKNDLKSLDDLLMNYPLYESKTERVMHGAVLQSRLRGLFITADSLSTMLQGFDTSESKNSFISDIAHITNTQTRCFILPNARPLGNLEQIWTGEAPYSAALFNSTDETLVSFQVRFWVTREWKLMREVNYLAITINAYKHLVPQSTRQNLAEKWKTVPTERFVAFVKDVDQAFREDFLLRCFEEQILDLHHTPRLRFQQDARLRRPGRLGQLVRSTYHRYRIGHISPTQPFIRETEIIENIVPNSENTFWDKHENGILVNGPPFGICLYVTNRDRADFRPHSEELFKDLASRFTLDQQVFNARMAHSAGDYRFSMRKSKDWSQQQHLGSDEKFLNRLAKWILSDPSDRDHLEERRDLFPSIEMFEMLMQFKGQYRPDGELDWETTFTSTNKGTLSSINKV